MQNRCLRVALRRDQLSNVTDLHREASLLPLKYRINTSLLKILFDHSREPDNLDVKVRGSSTRLHDGPIFPVPFPKSEGFKKSVAYYMVQLSGTLSLTISGWQVIRNTLHAC